VHVLPNDAPGLFGDYRHLSAMAVGLLHLLQARSEMYETEFV
jgi:hypothetical protein